MKSYGVFKNRVKPGWVFSQNGNMWRFVFAGRNAIAGETRDTEKNILYIFALNTIKGNTYIKNYLFENGNYRIAIEGANSSTIFLNRFDNPELPYHKNIIALDIHTGGKLWEHGEYNYFFCTEDKLYGIKQKFESAEFAELDMSDGSVVCVFPETQNSFIYGLKKESDEELFDENLNYPCDWNPSDNDLNTEENECVSEIIRKEIESKNNRGAVEYVRKDNLIIFNYYVPAGIDVKDINKIFYRNILCVYDISGSEKLFEDILNDKSNFNVPDNFFTRDSLLYYLREKKEIVCVNLANIR